jgi:hypothetical protein
MKMILVDFPCIHEINTICATFIHKTDWLYQQCRTEGRADLVVVLLAMFGSKHNKSWFIVW